MQSSGAASSAVFPASQLNPDSPRPTRQAHHSQQYSSPTTRRPREDRKP